MSERTPEDKKNDLENALLQAKRKDIDGIPWYQSEAMADEIERLRDVLANEVKHHVAKIDRIKELEHSAAWETPACATYRIRAEAAESQVAALTASLAELRKRMGEAETKIHESACLVLAAVTSEDGLDGSDVPKWIMDYGLLIASVPSSRL